MDERTKDATLVVEVFTGVNDIVDELKLSPDLTPWSHGGYFNDRAGFQRLPGKLLNSSNTTGGHVLTLQHLKFEDRDVVFVHQSTTWKIDDNLSKLATVPDDTTNPLEPFIAP